MNALHNLERRNGVSWIRLVGSGARNDIAVVLGLTNFASEHRLHVLGLLAFGVVLTGSGIHVSADLIVGFSINSVHCEIRLSFLVLRVALINVLALQVFMVVHARSGILLGEINKARVRN